jgi:hypothetical protein
MVAIEALEMAEKGERVKARTANVALDLNGGQSRANGLTCETSGSYRHCLDHDGYLST